MIFKIIISLIVLLLPLPGFCKSSPHNGTAFCKFIGDSESLPKKALSKENIISFSNEVGIAEISFEGMSVSMKENKLSRIEFAFSGTGLDIAGNTIMSKASLVNFLAEVKNSNNLIVSLTESLDKTLEPEVEVKTSKSINKKIKGTISITIPNTFIIEDQEIIDLLKNKSYIDGDIRKGITITEEEQNKIQNALQNAKNNGQVQINCNFRNIKVN